MSQIERPRVLITEHAEGRAEGIPELVVAAGGDIQLARLYQGESLPLTNNVDALISAGGPMSVYEMNMPEYDFLKHEAEFLAKMISERKAVLGICLGHQLLAHVLGSKVVSDPKKAEVGWSKITLNLTGLKDPLYQGVPENFWSFEYHKDNVIELPSGCFVLANTPLCEIQSFRFGEKPVWGVQFHPEISPEKAKNILESRKETIEQMGLDVFLLIKQGFYANQQPRKQIFYNFLKLIV